MKVEIRKPASSSLNTIMIFDEFWILIDRRNENLRLYHDTHIWENLYGKDTCHICGEKIPPLVLAAAMVHRI